MRLYIMRHGETAWNVRRLFQGHSDIPLNENGIALAEVTADGLRDVPFDLAYTSPLRRARQTAEIILRSRTPICSTSSGIRGTTAPPKAASPFQICALGCART